MDNRIATAEWIEPSRVASQFPYRNGTFWLGRTIDQNAEPIGIGDDRHVLIVGGTRGGKGTTLLVNNLCHWPGSAIVVDPKGENATVTAERRGKGNQFCDGLGQAVHVLDPYRVAKVPDEYRASFNPLDWLDGDDDLCTKKAERLATSLVPFKTKSEEYWDNESRGLIGALLVHIATSPFFEGRRDLLTLRDLVMRGDAVSCEELKEAGVEEIQSPFDLLWESMMDNTACHGYVRDSGNYFSDLARDSEKQWAGVRGGVKTATDFLSSKGMREVLSKSDFQISDIKKDPNGRTIYLSIPQDFIATDCGWLRMMIDMVSTEAKLIEGQPRAGYPILLMLDEFAGLRRMDVLEKSIAQIAGYGVKMTCVVQELGQLEDVYDKNWETFINGSGVRIFFANGDARTKEYVSKMAGDIEIVRNLNTNSETEGQSFSIQKGRSTSWGSSQNFGSGWSLGGNYGGNSGANYQPGGLLTFFPTKTGDNRGSGGGLNANYNRSRGGGTHESSGESFSESETYQTSSSKGLNESLFKRRLIEAHDVEQKFARIEDKKDPRYPGVALVMVAGYPPMPIRKCNYFEDPAFHRSFTPHPDHKYVPLLPEELETPFRYLGNSPPATVIALSTPSTRLLERYAPRGSYYIPGGSLFYDRNVAKISEQNPGVIEQWEANLWMQGEYCQQGVPALNLLYAKKEGVKAIGAYSITFPISGVAYSYKPFKTVDRGEPFLLVECRSEEIDEWKARNPGGFADSEEALKLLQNCKEHCRQTGLKHLLWLGGYFLPGLTVIVLWILGLIGLGLTGITLLMAWCMFRFGYDKFLNHWSGVREWLECDHEETLQLIGECVQVIDNPFRNPSFYRGRDIEKAAANRTEYKLDLGSGDWRITGCSSQEDETEAILD